MEAKDAGLGTDEKGDHLGPWGRRGSLTPRRTYSSVSRVVYDRPRHYFSAKDVERIARNYVARPVKRDDKPPSPSFLQMLQDLTINMLERILAIVGKEEAAVSLYTFLINLGNSAATRLFGKGNWEKWNADTEEFIRSITGE